MDISQNLALFRELMLCDGTIYSWCYDAEGSLLESNCPETEILSPVFQTFGCLERMLRLGSKRTAPIFLSTDTGLVWGAAFEKENGALLRCHVIGPVFFSNASVDGCYRSFRRMDLSQRGAAWIHSLYDALNRLPTSQYIIFSRNLRMLHYCITGQHLNISDVYVDDIQSPAAPGDGDRLPVTDRYQVYKAEKAMLQMVRLGDLNYKEALSASMNISNGVKVTTRDPLKDARVSSIVFCSIVCRAAIEGGLSPEEAYSVGDAYIQSAMDAGSIGETSAVCISMYDDFIHRVHKRRENPRFSEPIQRCCNYIEMNLDRNLRAKELSDLVGYSVTYFTRRFREETGFGISDYVKAARVERAKILLETTQSSVQDISDKLGFTTRNYFTKCFRDVTGMTPVEYRGKK